MKRAVDILARIYERGRERADTIPPPLDRPMMLFSETIALELGVTTQDQVERALGIAFAYPARGWHTYASTGRGRAREFVSLFYSAGRLVSAELYVPKSERAPSLAPRDVHFRIVPGEIALGIAATALPDSFGKVSAMAERLGAFSVMCAARFPGGSAYAMGNDGIIERLALYGGA